MTAMGSTSNQACFSYARYMVKVVSYVIACLFIIVLRALSERKIVRERWLSS